MININFNFSKNRPNLLIDRPLPFWIGSRAMLRRMLKSKIHRATVTDACVHYEGSVTIDADLLTAADIRAYEEVHVWDVTSGARLVTYAMAGAPGSGVVAMNGAAALLVKQGDTVIIGSYADFAEGELAGFKPRKVFVDAKNRIAANPEGDEC